MQRFQNTVSILPIDSAFDLVLPEPGCIDAQEGKGVLQLLEEVLHQEDEVLMREPEAFVVGESLQMSLQEGFCLLFGFGHEGLD
ncbi:hypothetical protein DT383_21290 [Pseudomonas aeruginosa]|nr:hypothetical protein D407_0208140 [Pseudomonas aeruginosa]RCI64338.1 hypothetical protein DT383_21290 [Pseudomonas aeruginosa]RPP85873.1 hypothetical protein IPC1133_06905 [Pseudomonas aeruginosa]RPP98498.1 hypothetical protein IPC1125_15405 [Pseudomonas aeruginosa]